MKKASVKSVCEKYIGFIIVAIAIAISVKKDFLTITSVNAFSVVPSQPFASRKSFVNHNGGTEHYKSIHRLYQSNLFAHERLHNSDAERFENSTKKQVKRTTNGDFQKALAGLVVALTIVTGTVGGFPLPANAGFGPSSAATTTPPPNLNSIKTSAAKVAPEKAPMTDFDIDLDGKKLKILIDSTLNVRRLEEFSGQLDDLIDNLKDSISSLDLTFGGDDDDDEQKEELRETGNLRQEELRKAENIRLQVEEQEKRLQKLERQPYWFNYFAAFVGATVSTVAMHPVDTIKIRMQVGIDDDGDDKGDGRGTETGDVPLKTKQVSIASAIGSGSIGSLYQGLTGNLFKEVPSQAIYLGVYESVKLALSPKVAPEYLLWVYLVAGAAGETVGSVLRAPAEAVKSLVQSKAQANAWEAAKSVLGTPNGRQNVVRAWSASIGRDVPFGGIQLAIFEAIKAGILNDPNLEIDSSTLLSEAFIGAFAGGVGAFVTNPTDVIITRIITQDTTTTSGKDNEEDLETTAPLGVLEMGRKIYQEEGVGAFFVGWVPRVGYWAPAIGMFLSCYCSVRRAGITYDWFP